MSTEFNRKELVKKLNEHVEDNGNINVLMVHAIAQHIGLSATEFECLDLIQRKGPCTAGELAKWCRISSGGMTGMLDRLEQAGFVQRTPDSGDRRRVLVKAIHNEAASKKVFELYTPLRLAFESVLGSYTNEELAFIVEFIDRINTIMHEAAEQLPEK